jgi:hypothetical protein
MMKREQRCFPGSDPITDGKIAVNAGKAPQSRSTFTTAMVDFVPKGGLVSTRLDRAAGGSFEPSCWEMQPMISEKQREANRRKALQSTSPRTAQGVEAVLTHKQFVASLDRRAVVPIGSLVSSERRA